MKKKNKWIVPIVLVAIAVILSTIFGIRFVLKFLETEPVEAQNYYKNAFVQPNTILNRCGGGESGRNYYFDIENLHESVSIWINTITNEGEVTYFIDGERVVKNRAVYKDGYIYVYTDDSQNPVELVSGLPYQLFEYNEFKITYTFADFADPHTQRLEGNVTPNEDQSMIQKKLFLQLKEMYNFDMNVEDINGKQIFKMKFMPEWNGAVNYDTTYFTTNINGLTISESCVTKSETYEK